MAEFDDIMAAGLEAFMAAVGAVPFQIAGKTFAGDYSEFSAEKSFDGDGPMEGVYPATILAARTQFVGKFSEPLEKSLADQRLVVKGRTFRISRAVVDGSSVTLQLENVNATK